MRDDGPGQAPHGSTREPAADATGPGGGGADRPAPGGGADRLSPGSGGDDRSAPGPVRELQLDLAGTRVNCLVAGDSGPPVLLLHGGGVDSAAFSWALAAPALATRHRVVAPDWPGYGRSDDPAEPLTSTRAYADLVAPLLDELGLQRASLVGLSLGGGAALSFALREPDRVDRLVLVDSYGLGREVPWGKVGYLLVHAPGVDDLSWAMLRRSRSMLRWSLYGVVHDRRAVTPELLDEAWRAVRRPGAARAFQTWRRAEVGWDGLRTDLSDQLGDLRVPTLLVHGRQDRAVPVAWAERAARRIPDAELRVLDECGHMPPRERPAEFHEAVLSFLAR